MRILLDHCVDWRFGRYLPGHDVKSARRMGWAGLKNGKLLARAGLQFDVLLTVDRDIQHQQNLGQLPIAVVVMIARSNKLTSLIPLVAKVEQALLVISPRTLVEVSLSSP